MLYESITEVFLWLKQAARKIFSEKCLGQKYSLLYYIKLNSVFNQAVIQILEQIQICFPEEKSVFATDSIAGQSRLLTFNGLPGLPTSPVRKRHGFHFCPPTTCAPVRKISLWVFIRALVHGCLPSLLRPPFLSFTISYLYLSHSTKIIPSFTSLVQALLV